MMVVLVKPPKYDGFAVSPVMMDKSGEVLYVGLSEDDEFMIPVELEEIGNHLKRITIGVEDKRFYSHFGVDLLAVARAVVQNVGSLRVVSGASTITVQLVRLSKPRPRNLWSKMIEFVEAVKLERQLSKDEIFELYLNRAPFGGNIRGVGAAAKIYFGKKPDQLSLGESAILVALLRGPSIYRPDRWPERARQRRDLILARLRQNGFISSEEMEGAKLEPVSDHRFQPPRKTPHLAAFLLPQARDKRWHWGAVGFKGEKTTIDPLLQENLEKRLKLALRSFPDQVNGAGLLVDNQSGQVLAYVGGVKNEGPTYWVDNVRSRRSPGSTLKPFIYLAAFTDGSLVPSSLLADSPLGLGGEAPRNFDGHYRGPVSADMALAESLNAPAVRVLRLVGETKALEFLRKAGLSVPEGYSYGDSLVLGGMETSMMELAVAYGTLARGGEAMRISFDPQVVSKGPRIFSQEAVWLVNQSLSVPNRLPAGLTGDGLAFKSGTSNNLRDAWLAVYDRNHTLVLWLGDPSGRSYEGLSGLASLSSTGIQYMRDLGPTALWPEPPKGLERYLACPLSGQPASPFCPGAKWAWRIKSLAKNHPCRLHGHRQGQMVTLWPPELARFMGGTRSLAGPKAQRPRVISPLPGSEVVIDDQTPRVPLKSEGTFGLVHWYLDDQFLETAEHWATVTALPGPGTHKVSLMDSRNLTAKSEFTVIHRSLVASDIRDVPLLRFD
jgi:penicillin-binding protein 1C